MKYSVWLVIPNLIAREGLSRILQSEGFQVVATSSSADEIVAEASDEPDLCLIDVPTAEEQTRSIATIKAHVPCKTVVMADVFDVRTMLECFSQGADGYIVKTMPCSNLVASLRLAALGHKIMPSELADHLDPQMGLRDESPSRWSSSPGVGEAELSEREQVVLQYLISGDPNKTIGRKLGITETTVKVHVKAILRKLNVLNRTQAAIWAMSRGLDRGPQDAWPD